MCAGQNLSKNLQSSPLFVFFADCAAAEDCSVIVERETLGSEDLALEERNIFFLFFFELLSDSKKIFQY